MQFLFVLVLRGIQAELNFIFDFAGAGIIASTCKSITSHKKLKLHFPIKLLVYSFRSFYSPLFVAKYNVSWCSCMVLCISQRYQVCSQMSECVMPMCGRFTL